MKAIRLWCNLFLRKKIDSVLVKQAAALHQFRKDLDQFCVDHHRRTSTLVSYGDNPCIGLSSSRRYIFYLKCMLVLFDWNLQDHLRVWVSDCLFFNSWKYVKIFWKSYPTAQPKHNSCNCCCTIETGSWVVGSIYRDNPCDWRFIRPNHVVCIGFRSRILNCLNSFSNWACPLLVCNLCFEIWTAIGWNLCYLHVLTQLSVGPKIQVVLTQLVVWFGVDVLSIQLVGFELLMLREVGSRFIGLGSTSG